MKKGSITVFLSLLSGIIITLIMAMTEHTRIYGLRERLTSAAGSAMNSLFSMYDNKLLEEFDLLLLNRNELESRGSVEEILEEYLTVNLNPRIGHFFLSGNMYRGIRVSAELDEEITITENEGELFARNVVAYMKYRTFGIALEKIEEQLTDIEKGKNAQSQVEQEKEEIREISQELLTQEITEEERKQYEEAVGESWLDTIEMLRKDGWLDFVLPFDKAASSYVIKSSYLPSAWRSVNLTWYHSAVSEIEERFLFTEYLLEHCRCFTSPEETKGMAYELEYILNGRQSDRENLKNTITSLLILREGMNLLSALKDPALSGQAETAAAALVGWTGVYPAVKLVQLAMMAGWSFAESIIDLRTLLSGGKVPVMKDAGNWNLSLWQIGDFLDGKYLMAGKGESGLDYTGYLRLLLYALGRQDRRYRTMDVIQMRIAREKPDFCLEDCLGGLQVSFKMEAKPLFFSFDNLWYTIKSVQSRMY